MKIFLHNMKIFYNTVLWQTHQFSLGQTTLDAVSEQVSRQLQGQRTYFLPEGGGAMGWGRGTREEGP